MSKTKADLKNHISIMFLFKPEACKLLLCLYPVQLSLSIQQVTPPVTILCLPNHQCNMILTTSQVFGLGLLHCFWGSAIYNENCFVTSFAIPLEY